MIIYKILTLFTSHAKPLLSLFLICFSIIGNASIYYIDNLNGEDANNGLSERLAWKSLTKINNSKFIPGDRIYFKRGQQWEGMLSIPSSGTAENPIIFGAYGTGKNPVISRAVPFSDWKLLKKDDTRKVWSGTITGLRNSWGMLKNGSRVEKHRQYMKLMIDKIEDEHFYSPLNGQRFYYRDDSGNPGKVFIGAYEEAIRISNKHHIVIEDIDTIGPGGRKKSGSSTGYRIVSINNYSHDVTLKDMTISHGNSFGVWSDKTTRNISYYSLNAHDNGGTGIYMNSVNGIILNCKSYNNGRLKTDAGDRGGIGVYLGSNILIKDNEVHDNGRENDTADFEISIVGATGQVIVEKNYIHDCIQGCLQIAEGGDNSIIAYNIISKYGTANAKVTSPGLYSGIRIGGGVGGARNVKIVNNIIHGGQQPENSKEAALYIGWYDNSYLVVQNNIFSQSINKNIYIRSTAVINNSIFSNNLFSPVQSDIGINYREKKISDLSEWQKISGYGSGSFMSPALFTNESHNFSLPTDFKLQSKSPALKNGRPVGQLSDFNGQSLPGEIAPDIGIFQQTKN